MRSAFPLLLLLALGACDLGPDYHAPVPDLPADYREHINAPVWPAAEWWRGFGSPELNSLIAEAETSNFDIAAAAARVVQADAQVRISGAPLLPAVDANGKAQWQRQAYRRNSSSTSISSLSTSQQVASAGSSSASNIYYETRQYSLLPSVSYELDFWGRLRATQDSAEASALFSRYDQETVALTAISSVATTWFTALQYNDRLAVARRNLSDSTEILKAIQARLDAGTASQLDVSQQAALVAGIRATVPDLESQMQQQLNGLGILVGHPPEWVTAKPGTLTTLATPEVSPGLPSDLLLRRPDVASAEAQLIAANANIREARANFFPQITLTGSGGWESVALGTLFGPGSIFASFAANAAQTIFDNGLKGGQYAQNKGRYDELLADYRKAVVQAFTDVENALVAYRFATEQEKLEQDAVNTAQLASDIARAQLLAGTSDIVTALQAQTTLFNDLDLLAQVRLTRFQALVNLYKALGGGWQRSDVISPSSTIYHGVL